MGLVFPIQFQLLCLCASSSSCPILLGGSVVLCGGCIVLCVGNKVLYDGSIELYDGYTVFNMG